MSLKTRIRALAAQRGIVFDRESVDNSAAMRRQRLLASLEADVVLDVGANVGVYGQGLRRYGYTGRIVSLEPLSGAYRRLETAAAGDEAWSTRQVALGDEDGTAEINLSASDPWSSLLPTHPDADEPIESEISLEPFYEGQPTVRQMIDALDDHGFALAVVGNGWIRDSGRARWMDGTFVRHDMLR